MSGTLNDMLSKLKAAEDELIELTDEDIADLLGDLKDKVDAIREVMLRMEVWEETIAAEIKELTARKKALGSSQDRFKAYMLHVMNENEFKQLPGQKYELKVMSRKAYKATMAPTAAEYMQLGGDLVRKKTEFSFDHARLTAAFKEDPEEMAPYMRETSSRWLKFSVRRES